MHYWVKFNSLQQHFLVYFHLKDEHDSGSSSTSSKPIDKSVRLVDANVDISHVATPSEQQWIYLKRHLFRSLYLN